ncbi:MAG: NlpC/P60 family protein, partial [Roseburia hominis]|nr:NlpC/P60 family protein [Roseburia hominis]
SSSALRGCGYEVSLSSAQPGDIVCYSGHVGIYIGNGTIVHASTPSSGITYSNVTYRSPICVRRIF